MPLNPAEPRSIAAQLVFLFTLAAAFILSCALIVFYWIVVQHAVEEDNAVLNARVRALRSELHEPNGLDAINQELRPRRSGEPAVDWVRILDRSAPVVISPRMDELLPVSVFPPVGQALPKEYRAGERQFALLASAETVDGRQYTVQFAQDRSADERFRRKFGALLAMTIVLGTITSTAVAVTVTRRGLRPVRDMTNAVTQITPTHLDARLDASKWPRELQPLAIGFDQMLERLENSFTRLSQFSADLAHELRTPIANLLGEAQVALSRERGADQYREVIESGVAECERLSAIVDNLLFLARAEGAESQVQSSVFDARPVIEKMAAYYETIAEDRNVTIRCDGASKIFADQALFERALNNLIENALRFTPDGGHIDISVRSEDSLTLVSVRDTGCGIAPEHLPRVFDRFYRVDPARNAGGAGLGLSLVKSIVDLHGGSIEIESKVDHGTTAILTFPGAAQIN